MSKLLLAILTCAALVLLSSCQPEQITDANEAVLPDQEQTPQPVEVAREPASAGSDTAQPTAIELVVVDEGDVPSDSPANLQADELPADTVADETDLPVASDEKPDSGESDEKPDSGESDEPVEKEPTETEPPDTEPEAKTPAEPDITPEAIIYKKYDSVLKTYVDKGGNVNYLTLRRKRRDLFDAASQLAVLNPGKLVSFASDEEEMSFWINAHNMLTLKLIVDNYPIKKQWWMINYPANSIKQILGGREKTYFTITTFQHTLREIEQALLDKFNDPRLCFALSYASVSSPPLRNEAYTAAKLDKQLDDQIRKFLRKQTGIRIDRKGNIVHLSNIFILYEKNFIKSKYAKIKRLRERPENLRSFLNFAIEYVSAEDAKYLRTAQYDVKFMLFDWSLNEQTLK